MKQIQLKVVERTEEKVTFFISKQIVIYSGFTDMDELINQLLKERK